MRLLLQSTSPLLPFRWMVSGAPAALHKLPLVRSWAAALVLVGCVPAAQYEEAQSATEVAQEAERRTAARLAEIEAELEALAETHAAAERRLAEYDAEASQAALDRAHLEQQRDEHAELVNQLRSELARVGDHLRIYSEDRATLSERLEEAQTEIEGLQTRLEAARAAADEEGTSHAPERSAPQTSAPQPTAPQPSAPQPSAPQPSAPQPGPPTAGSRSQAVPDSVPPEGRARASEAPRGPASDG